MSRAPLIRDCQTEDVPTIEGIYRHAVLHGTGTFEIEAPSLEEMKRRHADVIGKGYPWIVAELEGRVAGFAYANTFRPRPAFHHTLEDSVYLAPDAQGRGVGRALLAELCGRCEALGIRQLVAVIGDADNLASRRLHAACGFRDQGVLPAVGWKFGRWLDVVLMQRSLGPGAATPLAAP